MSMHAENKRALEHYERFFQTGEYPLVAQFHMVDKRLSAIAHHIVIIHRNLAEHRCSAQLTMFGARKRHLQKIDEASAILEEVEQLQERFFDLRLRILQKLFPGPP